MRYRDYEEYVRQQATSESYMRAMVTMHLDVDGPPGCLIARAIWGKPPTPPMFEADDPIDHVPVALPAAQVQQLLTQHAGRAGAAIAATLGLAGLGQRLVSVLGCMICLDAHIDRTRCVLQTERIGAAGPGAAPPFRFLCRLQDGSTASASVPTFDDGVLVSDLVGIADTRSVLEPDTGVKTHLSDDGLALLLHRRFSGRPAAVAWAIAALTSMREDEADWLETIQTMRPDLSSFFASQYAQKDQVGWLARVLWTRPELTGLAMQVHRALMEQQPAAAPESRWSPGP